MAFQFSVDTYEHVLGHISKAAGKLHGLSGDADHIREKASQEFTGGVVTLGGVDEAFRKAEALNGKEAKVYIADLIICARQLAKLCPSGAFDIDKAIEERMAEKAANYLDQYEAAK